MDPDVAYAQILEAFDNIRMADRLDGCTNDEALHRAHQQHMAENALMMADAWEALDGWLKSGGFKPKAWNKPPPGPRPAVLSAYYGDDIPVPPPVRVASASCGYTGTEQHTCGRIICHKHRVCHDCNPSQSIT